MKKSARESGRRRLRSAPILVNLADATERPPEPPGDALAGRCRFLPVERRLLDTNDRQAARNRERLAAAGITALNLVSSPGAGKTTLLERTLDVLAREIRCAVLVGDLATDNDARRLQRPGVPVAQITTGSTCHLDAAMVSRGLEVLPLDGVRLLFIENVGNLVCPASFDLGENRRVVLLACTEGEDKPLKYPPMFTSAHAVVLTKQDLAAAAGCDAAAMRANVRRIAPRAARFELSARTGAGLEAWLEYVRACARR